MADYAALIRPTVRLIAKARRRRTAPHVRGRAARLPNLGALRPIRVPGSRLEIAERLILHQIELGEKLDDLIVRVAMIDEDVVADAVPAGTPDQLAPVLCQMIARVVDMRPVAQLEGNVVDLGACAADEVDGVNVWVVAQGGGE